MKVSKQLLEKLESIFKVLDFRVRYEKGSFKSGYCIIEEQKVVVINKFFPLESKVNVLSEILRGLEFEPNLLDESQRKIVQKIKQTQIQL